MIIVQLSDPTRELRRFVAPHPVIGPLDGWQWGRFLALHLLLDLVECGNRPQQRDAPVHGTEERENHGPIGNQCTQRQLTCFAVEQRDAEHACNERREARVAQR